MTTAGRPTWDTLKGGRGKWEGDLSSISKQYSVRDLPAHTKLKVRQEGQGRQEDIQGKDFKRSLEEKEKRLAQEKTGKGLASITAPAAATDDKRPSDSTETTASIVDISGSTLASSIKRPRTEAITIVPTANLDADDPWDEDYDEDEVGGTSGPSNLTSVVGNDDAVDGDNDADSDDEDEDEQVLLAELAKIKRERAEESAKMAAEKRAAEDTIRMENILKGNPLLTTASAAPEFKVKRRWDDDVVFKNCARGELDLLKRGFVNDTLRSEFHKKFMKKYIQ